MKSDEVKDLFIDSMKASLLNAGMMLLKMKNYSEALDVLKLAKQFSTQEKDIQKLSYRMSAAYNGLKRYKDAVELLSPYIKAETKDPLIKIEYKKAKRAIAEENKSTDDQKETYSKMFNPEKRKEEAKKQKEEKDSQKEKDDSEEEGSDLPKYAIAAAVLAGLGFILYKVLQNK